MPKKKQGERMVTNWEGMPKPTKPKKQHYIYAARDILKNKNGHYAYRISFEKMELLNCGTFNTLRGGFCKRFSQIDLLENLDIVLKKGEQVRIRIPVDEAEVVR